MADMCETQNTYNAIIQSEYPGNGLKSAKPAGHRAHLARYWHSESSLGRAIRAPLHEVTF